MLTSGLMFDGRSRMTNFLVRSLATSLVQTWITRLPIWYSNNERRQAEEKPFAGLQSFQYLCLNYEY